MQGSRTLEAMNVSLEDVRYIVFDLNGTLVIEDNLRYDEVLEDILKCCRKGRRLAVKDLREVAGGKLPLSEMISRLYVVNDPEDVSRRLISVKVSRTVLKEKSLDVLSALQEKYYLVLSSDTTGIAKEVVNNLDLSKYFVKAFYSCDIGYLKSEEGFWTALLSHFPRARTQEFLVVGDNPRADVYHPCRLGMHTVLVENPVKPSYDYREASTESDEEEPEYRIKELGEVLQLLGF